MGVLNVCGGCPKDVCKVSRGCLEGTKKVSEKFQHLFELKIILGPYIFWKQIILVINFSPKISLTQYLLDTEFL